MHYTKYTLGRDYDVAGFIHACVYDDSITKIAMYGAYDPKNIAQFNWTKKLQKKFTTDKNYFFFKKLESKGGKNKGNVDTEMGFDIAQDANLRDCLILFTGDGDFLYPIQKLIAQGKSIVVISTKGHMAKELIDFIASQDDSVCRYIDIHKNNTITNPIKHILKDSSRSICIHPDLYKRIQSVSNDEIIMLKKWMIATQHNTLTMINDIPSIISSNTNIKHILLRRQQEEKIEFIKYLDELAL